MAALSERGLRYERMRVSGVPGELVAIAKRGRKPFMPPMAETFAVPLRHSDVVVDIGAYAGAYAVRCARYPVTRVDAYECTPFTFGALVQNRLPNLRATHAAVVADDRQVVALHVGAGMGVTNSIVKGGKRECIEVPAVKYEDVVRDASIVKIDVEGAEYTFPIVQPTLRAIICEFHVIAGRDWRRRAHEIMEAIESAGFAAAVRPSFRHGWDMAGAWLRPRLTAGEYEPMMRGQVCCGCGASINAEARALCGACWRAWRAKHRSGYVHA